MVMQGFSVILHHNRAPPEVSFAPKSLPCLLFALLQQALNILLSVVIYDMSLHPKRLSVLSLGVVLSNILKS
jgi:hypothetical protein